MQKQVESEQEYADKQEQQLDLEKLSERKEQPRNLRLSGITIFCPLCKDYLSHSVTTTCQHTFCQICLAEYLLFLDECPQCCIKIRNQKQASNILLDNLILDYIKKFEPTEIQQYEKRLQQYKDFKRKRGVGQLETGSLVDIRDLDYVWCTGKVHRTVNKYQDKKVKYVIVKYDKTTKKEQIPQNSARLAPRGFYTARQDIPKYEKGKLVLRCPQEGVSYQLVQNSESAQEQQQKKEC